MSVALVPRPEATAERICELAAHIHAANAELARLAAEYDASGAWSGVGIRTCRHWLTINTGLSEHAADELLRVGHALADLPKLRDAFSTGRLSLDKMRAVAAVATTADEDVWLDVALAASGSQLQRICRAYQRSGLSEEADAREADERRSRRGLWTHWRDDGMLDLRAVLCAEDGAVVIAALEAAMSRTGTPAETPAAVAHRGGSDEEQAAARLDPAWERPAARRVDALVAVCVDPAHGSPHRAVVHVDLGVLTGETPGGRCHVEDGPALSASVARRLGCDAELVAVSERDGLPIDVGRTSRSIPPRLRTALQVRDKGCRFPGCGVPAKFTQGHHVQHWAHLGPTQLRNLLSLCSFHHGRHHDGAFRIELTVERVPMFLTPDGRSLGPPDGPPLVDPGRGGLRRLLGLSTEIIPRTTRALDGGRRFDLGYATEVIHGVCANRQARAPAQ